VYSDAACTRARGAIEIRSLDHATERTAGQIVFGRALASVDYGPTAETTTNCDAASFTVNSDSSLIALSPPGTGAVDVTVAGPDGTSAASSADRFACGRTVDRVEPDGGPPAGGTSVIISGVRHTAATAV
jgi:hypothetical protein